MKKVKEAVKEERRSEVKVEEDEEKKTGERQELVKSRHYYHDYRSFQRAHECSTELLSSLAEICFYRSH